MPGPAAKRGKILKARRAQDHVLPAQAVEIALPQREAHPQGAQLLAQGAEFLHRALFVAEGDHRPPLCKEGQQLPVGDPGPDKGHPLARKPLKKSFRFCLHLRKTPFPRFVRPGGRVRPQKRRAPADSFTIII